MDFFALSKLAEQLLSVGNIVAIALIGALAVAAIRPRVAPRIAAACALVLLFFLVVPVGAWILTPLENRFPHPAWPDRVDGVLVLGGGESREMLAIRGTAALIQSEGRYAAAVEAMRRYPNMRVVFAAGLDAPAGRAALAQLGANLNRIEFEASSRNTWENFDFSRPIARPRAGEIWLVIAHASQIPRAMGIARKIEWPVVPWPVDYRTGITPQIGLQFTDNLTDLDIAAHEWIGLVVYWTTGRSATLFPAPEG